TPSALLMPMRTTGPHQQVGIDIIGPLKTTKKEIATYYKTPNCLMGFYRSLGFPLWCPTLTPLRPRPGLR
ncbi:Pol polyprotein, partial [Schistosoma japonicum]